MHIALRIYTVTPVLSSNTLPTTGMQNPRLG